MTASRVIPAYQETIVESLMVRPVIDDQALPYPLTLPVISEAAVVRVVLESPDYLLQADAGVFTLTGQAATLTKIVPTILSAEAGTFALTGQAADLLKVRALTAEAGVFTLSGQAASLQAHRVLTAGTGSFALAGQDANLIKIADLLLLEMEGTNGSTTFTDSSGSARSVSASGGAAISTARSKFGTGSLLLSASGDYLTVSPPVSVSTGTPLTLDAWIYRTDSCVGTAIITEEYTGSGDTVAYALGFEEGSHVPFVGTYDGSGWIKSIGSADVGLNAWVNLRGVYNGSTWQLFVDDVAQTASGSVTVPNDADAMFVGRRWDEGGTNVFIGNIDRVRVR
jgi:hypothetical protein